MQTIRVSCPVFLASSVQARAILIHLLKPMEMLELNSEPENKKVFVSPSIQRPINLFYKYVNVAKFKIIYYKPRRICPPGCQFCSRTTEILSTCSESQFSESTYLRTRISTFPGSSVCTTLESSRLHSEVDFLFRFPRT